MTRAEKKNRYEAALADGNVQAMLRVIRFAEGTADPVGYRTMFTGKTFQAPPWLHPNIINEANGYKSTAAGAYQILNSTWKEISDQIELTTFDPHNQDLAAIALMDRRKNIVLPELVEGKYRGKRGPLTETSALDNVLCGDFEQAINKLSLEWASLPISAQNNVSAYGQPVKQMALLIDKFENNGGQLA